MIKRPPLPHGRGSDRAMHGNSGAIHYGAAMQYKWPPPRR
ncbi:hypothetical protein RAS1_37620 [Phycisphaerae bacterium RAS1]|nr:hypothetical protein RAS1_37620 [Phycisphaerae bacterium RAS1]